MDDDILMRAKTAGGQEWELIGKIDDPSFPLEMNIGEHAIVSMGQGPTDPKKAYLFMDSVMRQTVVTFYYGLHDDGLYYAGETPPSEPEGTVFAGKWAQAKPLPEGAYFTARPIGFEASRLVVNVIKRHGDVDWVDEAEPPLSAREVLEMVSDPMLVTQILLEVESAEPQVAPSEPGEDLDMDYFKRRVNIVRRVMAKHRQQRRPE